MSETISLTNTSTEADIPSTKGMTTRVVKGSIWTLVGQILPLFVSLVTAPFVIKFLGSESYGVLILIGLIPYYFSFADFGMGIASTKFASEVYIQGRKQAEGEVIRTAALIALTTSLIFIAPIFIFSHPIIVLLKVPEHLQAQASVALKLSSITFVSATLSSIFNTPQLSRLRMDINSAVNAGSKVLLAVLSPLVLYFGGGLVEVALTGMIVTTLGLAAHIFFSGRLLKELYQTTVDKNLVKPLIRFGGGLLISGIAAILLTNLEKLFLTGLVSVQSLAYYSIAFTFANMATMFSVAMIQSLIPAFSQLLEPGKRAEFETLFSRSVRINLIWILPGIMFLFVIARPFFTFWAGAEFGEQSTYPFYVLLLGLFFNLLAYVPHSTITAFGRTDVFAKLYWFELFLYVFLVISLVSSLQITGAALAWSLRVIIDAAVIIWFAKKLVGVSFRFSDYSVGLALGILFLTPPVLVAAFYDNFSIWLIFLVPFCIALYSLLVWNKFVEHDERVWIKNIIKTRIGLK